MNNFSSFFAENSQSDGVSARALLWEHTLHQVILLLEEAERRIRSAEGQQRLTKLTGWWRIKKSKLNGESVRVPAEEAISEALWEEIERVKEDIILKIIPADPSMSNLDTLQVSPETPRRKKSGIGKRSKPTDLRFYRTGSEILDLRIEAKIVLRDNDISGSYLSKKGLKRFSDPQEPYTDQEMGGMLAYTVTNDRTAWLAKIDSALQGSSPPTPTFRHRVHAATEETLFCRVPYRAESADRDEVLVFHLVLQFESDPSART